MWEVINNTPFAAERSWVRAKNGAEVWLVAVKATFDVTPEGATRLSDEQVGVNVAPKFRGEPNTSSLLYDSDLHHTKVRTDVVLNGHAYAPGGHPTTHVNVRLTVAGIDKELHLVGNRYYHYSAVGLRLSKPQPFTSMPLIYERAYGGTDMRSNDPKKNGWEARNPVGCGFAMRSGHLDGLQAPNIFPGNGSEKEPAGFGPVAGHWEPRVRYAGTCDERWEKTRLPLLPEDFDERFYQSAPEDQQVPFLRGGEVVELFNLTPNGLLRFRLPRATLGFTTYFDGHDAESHRATLHTVVLEPNVPRVLMVWHTQLPCHHKVQKLLNTTVVLRRRVAIPQAEIAGGMWTGTA